MGTGVLWCVLAGLSLYAVKKVEKGKRGIVIVLFLCFAVFGICGILGDILDHEVLLNTSRFLAVSILCFVLFFKLVFDKKVCTTKVIGVYQGYHMFKSVRGYSSYAPVFHYYFQGREYQAQAYENYSLKKITARFTPGNSYEIYINDKNPNQYVTRSGQWGNKILLLSVGLFLLFGYIVSIMQ